MRHLKSESGASGEIRTLKHLFLRQAAIPIRARWHFYMRATPPKQAATPSPIARAGQHSHWLTWCTGEDLNLRALKRTAGLQPARLSLTHAPVQIWRKVDGSNAHGSSPCSGFRDQLPAIQQYLPHGGECGSRTH